MVNRPGCQTSVLPDPDLSREDAVSRRCVRGFRRRDGQGGEDRGAAAFSLWVKIGPPRTLEALRNEATVAALTAKVPASPEPDLRLGKAAARRRGCGFLGRDQHVGEPGGRDYRALHQEQDFSPEGPGDEPGPAHGDDRSRWCRSVVRRLCAARIGALWGLSQAGDAGCRRAGADAVARTSRSGDAVRSPAPAKAGGSRRMAAMLRLPSCQVNRKRGAAADEAAGLEAPDPQPKTSRPSAQHRIYPYLRRGLAIGRTTCGLPTSPTSGCPRLPPYARPGASSAMNNTFLIISRAP